MDVLCKFTENYCEAMLAKLEILKIVLPTLPVKCTVVSDNCAH